MNYIKDIVESIDPDVMALTPYSNTHHVVIFCAHPS